MEISAMKRRVRNAFMSFISGLVLGSQSDHFLCQYVGLTLSTLAIQSKQAHGQKPRLTGLRILNSMQWVREHLAEPLVLPEIARRAGLSVPHFCALFKKQTGMSPMRYLMHARMTRACALLDSTDKSVAEISSEVGFRDAFHFTKTFRAVVGSSPSNYRLASSADFAVGSNHKR
ncbi:AraC family transcriptional regulator [bacterium]|nr:AraC family transcriptional regulator [bacterium]